MVQNTATDPGQAGWRWCLKCQGLFFGLNQAQSVCPAGGTHDGSQSGNYSLRTNQTVIAADAQWRWCQKCQGNYHSGPSNSVAGTCPAGAAHDGSQSAIYAMHLTDRAVFTLSDPDLVRGGGQVWTTGSSTPYLRWLDGSETRVRVVVRPYNPGDASITVEWLAEYDTWVDFNYTFLEFGTFIFPFNSLGEGLSAVSYGGNLFIKSGTTPETAGITKRMNIQAYGGPVTLGQ
jgi:hypothetical protein